MGIEMQKIQFDFVFNQGAEGHRPPLIYRKDEPYRLSAPVVCRRIPLLQLGARPLPHKRTHDEFRHGNSLPLPPLLILQVVDFTPPSRPSRGNLVSSHLHRRCSQITELVIIFGTRAKTYAGIGIKSIRIYILLYTLFENCYEFAAYLLTLCY